MESKPEVKIENWFLSVDGERLMGEVHGHPRFDDGTFVNTSSIVESSERTIETRNTIYILGKQQEAGE